MTRASTLPSTTLRRRRLGAVALGLVVTLGACSSDDGDADGPQPIPSDFLSDSAAPTQEDGLPDDFPRDLVPVVEGRVVSSESAGDGSYAATVVSPSSTFEAAEQAVARLESAGWENQSEESIGADDVQVAQFLGRGDGSLAILTVFDNGDEATVTYAVTLP